MNSTTNIWPSLKFRFLAIQLQYHPNRGWYKHSVCTSEFLNLFLIKIYQNSLREDFDADQCYQDIDKIYIYVLCNYHPNISSFEHKLCIKHFVVVFETTQLSGTGTDRQNYSAFAWSLYLYCWEEGLKI